MDCRMPGFSVLYHLPEFAQFHVHWVTDAIQTSHLLSPSSPLPSIFPRIRSFLMSWLFTSGNQSIGASASASVLPMNIQGWFFFRIDWFGLLAVQGTLRSSPAPQFKASVLWHSAFFMVQLSHLSWKNHSFGYTNLYRQSDVSAF